MARRQSTRRRQRRPARRLGKAAGQWRGDRQSVPERRRARTRRCGGPVEARRRRRQLSQWSRRAWGRGRRGRPWRDDDGRGGATPAWGRMKTAATAASVAEAEVVVGHGGGARARGGALADGGEAMVAAGNGRRKWLRGEGRELGGFGEKDKRRRHCGDAVGVGAAQAFGVDGFKEKEAGHSGGTAA
uniref:Uncharacterized protein n=1 Tax=Oryza rufipogon TaxID=4529 RepID=A0A0E0NEU5_ORYRU